MVSGYAVIMSAALRFLACEPLGLLETVIDVLERRMKSLICPFLLFGHLPLEEYDAKHGGLEASVGVLASRYNPCSRPRRTSSKASSPFPLRHTSR